MLFSLGAYSESDKVIDQATVEAQDHVRINLVYLVLVVADYVVEAAVGVDLCLHCDAILHVLKHLVHYVDPLSLIIGGTGLLFLSVRARVMLIKVVAFNRLLQNLDYLLASVLFVGRWVLPRFYWLSWLIALVVDHLVYLRQVLLLPCWDSKDLLVLILPRLISEEDIYGAIFEYNDELVGVLAFNHWLEPPNVYHFPLLLHLWPLVVLYDHAFILQLRVIATYCASVCAQQELYLRLVPALDLIFALRSF